MDWLACLEAMADYYCWKRDHHPPYPDLRLEWGLYHSLRGGLALAAAKSEGERHDAVGMIAEARRELAALKEADCRFADFHDWEAWSAEQFPAEGEAPSAPGETELRTRLTDWAGPEREALVSHLVAAVEPLSELPEFMCRAVLCPAFRRLFASMAEFQAHRGDGEAAALLYAWAALTGRRLARHWVYRAQWERICGDYGRVEELLGEGLEHIPDDIELLREMAAEKDRQGQIGDAVLLLEKAVDIQPGWPDLRYDLARLYGEDERHEASLAQFGKALELNPVYEKAAISEVETLLRLGELDAAERRLLDLQEQELRSERVYRLLSQIYAERGDPRRAEHFAVLGQQPAGSEDSSR